MLPFSGIILAGGASRRMGHDKASIRLGNHTMLDHMRALMVQAGAVSTAVLGRPDLPDGVADQAPLAGPVHALIDYLKRQPSASRHLVVPVDMPGLTTSVLHKLAVQPGWACFDGYMLPMLAVAGAVPETPPRRLRDLLRLQKAAALSLTQGERQAFINLNTPLELALWQKSKGKTSHV